MHEVDPAYADPTPINQSAMEVAKWRKGERNRLIGERLAAPAELRTQAAQRIAYRLTQEIGNPR